VHRSIQTCCTHIFHKTGRQAKELGLRLARVGKGSWALLVRG